MATTVDKVREKTIVEHVVLMDAICRSRISRQRYAHAFWRIWRSILNTDGRYRWPKRRRIRQHHSILVQR